MQTVPIPHDIFTNIIDELSDDNTTLRQCCRVSHAFLNIAQPHLWSTLQLQHLTQYEYSHLSDALINGPHLLSYVRELTVSDILPTADTTVVLLLQMFLRQGSLQSFSVAPQFLVSWEDLTSQIQRLFLDLFKSPNISSLTIKQIDCFPIVRLRHCHQLKRLFLISCPVRNPESPTGITVLPENSEAHSGVGYLDTLKVRHTDLPNLLQIFRSSCPLLRVSRLRELTIGDDNAWGDEENSEDVKQLITACAPTLQSIEWPVSLLHLAEVYDLISLSIMPNLRSLCFFNSEGVGQAARLVLSLLDNTTGTFGCKMEKVRLVFGYTSTGPPCLSGIADDTVWHELDICLRRRFSQLQRVDICFESTSNSGVHMMDDVVHRLWDQMPLLREAGVLHVQTCLGFCSLTTDAL